MPIAEMTIFLSSLSLRTALVACLPPACSYLSVCLSAVEYATSETFALQVETAAAAAAVCFSRCLGGGKGGRHFPSQSQCPENLYLIVSVTCTSIH
jgi:hypothetical protein